ncbi:MAG TPA: PIG-L deacetylase family protein [Chloroflexota bacterium]|nr:PIG-L deacetylase family protein [Chloroflexota bacterium]
MTGASLEPLPEDWSRALAVVAHPDDLEYGAASAVARWTSHGKEVRYLLVTRGEAGIDTVPPEESGPLRAEEEERSAAVVGAASVEFLGYHDGVVEYGLPLRRDIARAIRKHRPEVLISLNYQGTWGSPGGYRAPNSADHRAVALALLDAASDAGNRWIFRELLDEGLEPWGGARLVCFNGSPTPTHGVDITGFLDQGVASLREHTTYLAQFADFDPETFLRGGAEHGGKQLGCELAVTFEVFRR